MIAAKIGDRNAGLVLLQDAYDLFFRKSTALHVLVLRMGQNELQAELALRGNVNAERTAVKVSPDGIRALVAHVEGVTNPMLLSEIDIEDRSVSPL